MPNKIKNTNNKIEILKEMANSYDSQIQALSSNGKDVNTNDMLKTMVDSQQKNNEAIQKLTKDMIENEEKIPELDKELSQLDMDSPVLYWRDSVNEKRAFMALFGQTRKEFNYKGVPYEYIKWSDTDGEIERLKKVGKMETSSHRTGQKHSGISGRFFNTENEPDKGVFKTIYLSQYGSDGTAEVQIYAKKRSIPENSRRIADLKQELTDKRKQIKHSKSEIGDLQSKNASIVPVVISVIEAMQSSKAGDAKRTQKMSQLETERYRLLGKIELLQEKTSKLRRVISEDTRDIESNKKLFEIVKKILDIMNLNLPLIEEFKVLYTKLSKQVDPLANSAEMNGQTRITTRADNNAVLWYDTLIKAIKEWELNKISSLHDSHNEHLSQLNQIAHSLGFRLQNVPGDGRCFFHAVLHQLQNSSLQEQYASWTTEDLIARTVQYIIDHIKEFSEFIQGDLDTFIERMARGNQWADHVSILALSKMLNIKAMIINSDGSRPIIVGDANAKVTIYLAYEVEWHYQSLIQDPALIPTRSLEEYTNQFNAGAQTGHPVITKPEETRSNDLQQSRTNLSQSIASIYAEFALIPNMNDNSQDNQASSASVSNDQTTNENTHLTTNSTP